MTPGQFLGGDKDGALKHARQPPHQLGYISSCWVYFQRKCYSHQAKCHSPSRKQWKIVRTKQTILLHPDLKLFPFKCFCVLGLSHLLKREGSLSPCKIRTLQNKVEMVIKCSTSTMPRLNKQTLGLDFLALKAYTTTTLDLRLLSYLQILLVMCRLPEPSGDYWQSCR